ncbi:MAG: ABC transporter ATP-binding protein [Firmicutes bacterium]|nr:ABC transporter ATP-binding protein [Bacillota bacterium]
MNPIEVKNLSFQYEKNTRKILDNLELTVAAGEIVAIVGLSGIGKSTLCYCLSGIIPHVYGGIMTGHVYLNGRDTRDLTLPQIATTLGIVFQNPDNQLFSFTVEDEVAFGPENLCLPPEEIECRVTDALEKVGMLKFRHANPQQLSGGQRQLIALASVLSLQPEILIFDEAMSQIDRRGKKMILEMMLKLKAEGRTIVMIEHDLENLFVADRVLVLKDGRLAPFAGKLS